MTKKQELNKKVFEETLKKHLKFLGYSLNENDLEEGENETGNFYRLFIGAFTLYFDDYRYYDEHLPFIAFLKQGFQIGCLFPNSYNPTSKTIIQRKHIKDDFNKEQLKLNKEKIRQLLEVDKTLSITAIAQELGITRQAIYKNTDLKKFIDNLK